MPDLKTNLLKDMVKRGYTPVFNEQGCAVYKDENVVIDGKSLFVVKETNETYKLSPVQNRR